MFEPEMEHNQKRFASLVAQQRRLAVIAVVASFVYAWLVLWLAPIPWIEFLIWAYIVIAIAAIGVFEIAKLRVFRRDLREQNGSDDRT